MLRLLLRLYPEAFRARFGEEIAADFEAGAGRWLDLLVSIHRERRAAGLPALWPVLVALSLAAPIGYLDLRASEVQGIVLLILLGAGGFGLLWPRRAWLWALLFGLSVPVWHLFGRSAYAVQPNAFATLMALIPAVLAASVGAGLRLASGEPKRNPPRRLG